jgi:hypothetical protein
MQVTFDIHCECLHRSEYSAGFLPEAIREESHVLEENGRWERVNYEGRYAKTDACHQDCGGREHWQTHPHSGFNE